jgi:integrase
MVLAVGQRRDEVATMAWPHIDEVARAWTIPSRATKARRAHVVPLSPIAIEILAQCRREILARWSVLGRYVFTTTNLVPIAGYSKAKHRLDHIAKLERFIRRTRPAAADQVLGVLRGGEDKLRDELAATIEAEMEDMRSTVGDEGLRDFLGLERWTIHDLRRTVGTGLGRLGTSRFIIGRVLNHADRSVTGIYDRHEYLPEKRHALEAWGLYLSNLTSAPGGGNVVALRG